MHGDHLGGPVRFALKPGDQALGPLPYAGYVNGLWVAQAQRRPLLLGKAPLTRGHTVVRAAHSFGNSSSNKNTVRTQALWDAVANVTFVSETFNGRSTTHRGGFRWVRLSMFGEPD